MPRRLKVDAGAFACALAGVIEFVDRKVFLWPIPHSLGWYSEPHPGVRIPQHEIRNPSRCHRAQAAFDSDQSGGNC